MMSQPEVKTEQITSEEKASLRKTATGTITVAVGMVAVLLAFGGFAATMISGFMSIAIIVFLIFFLIILVFIVSTRLKQANAVEKTVYTGIVREKKAETSGMRDSSNERYKVLLDDEWFSVEGHLYDQLHAGEKTALHTIGGKQVFRVERLEPATAQHVSQIHKDRERTETISRNSYRSNSEFETITAGERSVLRKAFWTAFIFRTLICGFAAYILFYVIILVSMFAILPGKYEMINIVYYADIAFTGLIFLLLNRKTFRIFLDLQQGRKLIVEERIIDKVSSNVRKPGPRSIVVNRNYTSIDLQWYYIQTANHWLSVSEEQYGQFQGGDHIRITKAKHSKIILDIS